LAGAVGTAPLGRRWLMLALVWLAYAAFGMVNTSLAPVVTLVIADLGLSYGQMGAVLGAWQLTYIGVAYAGGRIIDRVGLRRALGVGLLVIAASAILRGTAGGFWSLFLFVATFGLGGPMVSVGAPKLIAIWFTGAERGKAAGVYTTGSAIGRVVALSTANAVLLPLTGTWRLTVGAYGLVALAIGGLWWLLARDPPIEPAAAPAAAGDPRRLLRIRNVWLVLVVGLGSFLSSHALSNWLPRILQWHGLDPVGAGVWASIPNVVGIAGALALTRLVPRHRRTHAIAGMFATSALALGLIGLTTGAPLLAGLLLQGLVFSSITPLLLLVMMETPAVGAAAMGAAGGLYFTVGEIGGFVGPALMGRLYDLTGGFVVGLAINATLLLVMAVACLALERDAPALG
jgi:cyanate permease